jgi:hypothetical protein
MKEKVKKKLRTATTKKSIKLFFSLINDIDNAV